MSQTSKEINEDRDNLRQIFDDYLRLMDVTLHEDFYNTEIQTADFYRGVEMYFSRYEFVVDYAHRHFILLDRDHDSDYAYWQEKYKDYKKVMERRKSQGVKDV